jgi:hypothetical protein
MPHDINIQQSFEALPPKPTGQGKTWVRMTESLLNHQTPGMMRLVELASGAFRNMTLQPNRNVRHSIDLHLGYEKEP